MLDPAKMTAGEIRPRLLLHCCCAPCSSATLERLVDLFRTDIYYYNPNIEPLAEFEKRAGRRFALCAAFARRGM